MEQRFQEIKKSGMRTEIEFKYGMILSYPIPIRPVAIHTRSVQLACLTQACSFYCTFVVHLIPTVEISNG
ncbi:unnamed protein product [Prunus armeniaca]